MTDPLYAMTGADRDFFERLWRERGLTESKLRGFSLDERQLAKMQFKCSAACPAWGVMRITDTTLNESNWPTLTTAQPNTTFYNLYAVCIGQDATDGGDGFYYGCCTYLTHSSHVLCDSTYVPTVGQEWGPTSGSWALVRHRPGFLIDGGPAGSGATYRAVAKQRIVTLLRGILTTALVEGGSATVNLRLRNSATGLREASGITVTGYDDFLGTGETWPVSTRVVIDFEGGIWNVINAKCSPDSGGGGTGGGGGAGIARYSNLEGDFFTGGVSDSADGSADSDVPYEEDHDTLIGV